MNTRNPYTKQVRFLAACLLGMVLMSNLSSGYAQIIFSDDFSSGDLSKTQNGFKWLSGVRTKVVDFQGSKRLEFTYNAVTTGNDSWTEQRFTLGNYYREVWVKYDMYVPSQYILREPNVNDKSYLYLWTDNYSGKNGVGAGWQNWTKPDGSGNSNLSFVEWSGGGNFPHLYDWQRRPRAFDAHKGKWTSIVAQIKAGTGARDGLARLWRDGTLVFEIKDSKPYNNKSLHFMYVPGLNNQFNNGYLLGWSNNGFTQATRVYVDNVVFATTPLINVNIDPPNAPTLQ